MRAHERLSEHTRVLPPLVIGNCVRMQNMVGPHPTKWDRTGVVVEVRQFDQYVVRVDGSGRVTLRNRKYLRLYTPHIARAPLIYSPSVIPIAMTGRPRAAIQPDAPTPSTPSQPGLDGPASTTTGPTISMPTTPAMPDTGPELPPNDHAITEPPDVQQPVGHTSPRPRRTRRPPRRLVEEM